MAGWQAGLLVLVQSVLQHMHVVLPANTAANNLQTGSDAPLLAGRVHGWLASRAASACAECVAAYACLQTQLQTICKQVIKDAPLLAGRVHGWLASRAASACAECVAAYACGAACKHSCKQFANRSSQELGCCV